MATPQAALPVPPRLVVRSYRSYLTPLLHRRFLKAQLCALPVCYLAAVSMGDSRGVFWSWFPLGPSLFIRILLLGLASLMVLVLRVAHFHVGSRATASPLQTLTKSLLSFKIPSVLAFYVASACVYSETYIFFAPDYANLGWVDPGKAYERPRLNERPWLLRSMLIACGVGQTFWHIYKDFDHVPSPFPAISPTSRKIETPAPFAPKELINSYKTMVISTGFSCVTGLVVGIMSYYILGIRQLVYTYIALPASKVLLLRLSRADSFVGHVGPVSMFWRISFNALLLIFIWTVTNKAFTLYVAQEPLKKDAPITNDSRDPNGSLLNGLKSKKELPRNFAFRELAMVARRFEVRRQAIYQEIDRKPATTWQQVRDACLAEITGITTRIAAFQNPSVAAAAPATTAPPQIQQLPRLGQPLKQEQVLQSQKGTRLIDFASESAKGLGSHPDASPNAGKFIESSAKKFLNEGQLKMIEPAHVRQEGKGFLVTLLKYPPGKLFRQTFARRATSIVLGEPYTRVHTVANAIEALACLCAFSIREDKMGRVMEDVVAIIKTYAQTINTIQGFVGGLQPHWTDVDFKDGDKKVEEIEIVVDRLKRGLECIVLEFNEYLSSMGMESKEIRDVKMLVDSLKAPEMKEK